ncbi:alkaline phosphatase [Bacillus sp. SA1-12]|uniref:alkaline phosphatase D family protein n=1 Tax=Bacillus sp. SA1-12 TaxID=1455638 RepID=UPI000A07DAF7|nr:alkaline phosphatase D family protein [Bacillus sp. SA1-12]
MFYKKKSSLYVPDKEHMNRRRFLKFSGGTFASLVAASFLPVDAVLAASETPKFKDNPFKLGVASGDPLPDGVVLWTRLAPEPLAEDGLGGMPDHKVPVHWEIAEDENFRKVAKRGTSVAMPELAHSVHVEVSGLKPSRYYWYRFRAGTEISPVGRTKTAPGYGAKVPSLSFAFASCQAWYEGFYTAYKHMAQEDLDLVLHLGDYIYEYKIGPTGGVRNVPLPPVHNNQTVTLSQYRLRYSLFKTDPDLQAAHAKFPWVVTGDDHEVENNYADDISEYGVSREDFLAQRAAAYQAFYENLPLRSTSIPNGPDMLLYRKLSYGNLAQFNVLDTRQYRDDQIKTNTPTEETMDPNRTMLGKEQERWLLNNLGNSTATWNVLAQQIFMFQADHNSGPEMIIGNDTWDGYAGARKRLFSEIIERKVKNFVVLTGDAHRSVAAELKENFDDPNSATIGTEFLGTSITSGKDGADMDNLGREWLAANPHMKFHNAQRGYVRCNLTPDRWLTDFRVLPYVTRPDAPISTRASFVVENNRPGLQQA